MFSIGKIAGIGLLSAIVAVPGFAGDFVCPEECFFGGCRRMPPPPPPCREMSFEYSEVSIVEDDDGFTIRMVTPGVPKEDYAISVKNDILRIAIGKKKCEAKKGDGKDAKCDKPCPGFERAYKLPPNVDSAKIKAVYKDGVMTITIPKAKQPDKPEVSIAIE